MNCSVNKVNGEVSTERLSQRVIKMFDEHGFCLLNVQKLKTKKYFNFKELSPLLVMQQL